MVTMTIPQVGQRVRNVWEPTNGTHRIFRKRRPTIGTVVSVLEGIKRIFVTVKWDGDDYPQTFSFGIGLQVVEKHQERWTFWKWDYEAMKERGRR